MTFDRDKLRVAIGHVRNAVAMARWKGATYVTISTEAAAALVDVAERVQHTVDRIRESTKVQWQLSGWPGDRLISTDFSCRYDTSEAAEREAVRWLRQGGFVRSMRQVEVPA